MGRFFFYPLGRPYYKTVWRHLLFPFRNFFTHNPTEAIPLWVKILAFCPEHPKEDQNIKRENIKEKWWVTQSYSHVGVPPSPWDFRPNCTPLKFNYTIILLIVITEWRCWRHVIIWVILFSRCYGALRCWGIRISVEGNSRMTVRNELRSFRPKAFARTKVDSPDDIQHSTTWWT